MNTRSPLVLPPSVLQKTASPETSSRYVHIDTSKVVELMAREGFRPASVSVSGRGRKSDDLFTRHQIDFRREDWMSAPRDDHRGGYTPRVLFTNSHDGTTAASFMMGVFSFVCSNGLVVGSTYAKERVRHSGQSAADLIGRMQQLAKNTAPLFTQIDQWAAKKLTPLQVSEFARLASQLRWGDAHRFAAPEVLRIRRAEDAGADLWTVFNRVQENTIRGGLSGLSRTGRSATSRPLSEIAGSTIYNAQLWRLAEEFAEM